MAPAWHPAPSPLHDPIQCEGPASVSVSRGEENPEGSLSALKWRKGLDSLRAGQGRHEPSRQKPYPSEAGTHPLPFSTTLTFAFAHSVASRSSSTPPQRLPTPPAPPAFYRRASPYAVYALHKRQLPAFLYTYLLAPDHFPPQSEGILYRGMEAIVVAQRARPQEVPARELALVSPWARDSRSRRLLLLFLLLLLWTCTRQIAQHQPHSPASDLWLSLGSQPGD